MSLPPELADLESRLARRLDAALDDYRREVESRLREAGDRVAQLARELPAPRPEALLADAGLAALDLGSRRAAAREAVAGLRDALRELDRARTQAEALDVLLDRALEAADRVALLLVRDGELVGWGERGFEGRAWSERRIAAESAARLLARAGCLELGDGEAGALLGDLGVRGGSAAGAAVVVPLVLRDRVAALVWADRREGAPEIELLQILVTATAQRLELQPLTDRSRTPTLYAETDSDVEPLPLWSATATAPAPGIEAPPLESPAGTAVAELEAARAEPSFDFVDQAELRAGEAPAFEPPIEARFEPAAEAPELEAFAPLAAPAPEPVEPGGWEPIEEPAAGAVEELFEPVPESAAAAPAGIEAERPGEAYEEPEGSARTAAFPTPVFPSAPAEDLLGTVRMALPPIPPAIVTPPVETPPFEAPPVEEPPFEAPPFEEKTAPFEIVREAAPEPSGAGTHEIPIAPPAAEAEPDLSEDATVLSMRRPPIPPAPPAFAAPPPEPPEEDAHDRTSSRGRTTQVAPPPDVQGPGLAFVAGRSRTPSDSPVHEEAKRLARLLISEIKLYNEEQVIEGRRNRDLYHRLREDIDRSRQIFEERVDPGVRSETDYFQQELVRSLAGGDPRALGI